MKEASTLCGAAAAVSEEIGIATGVTNHPTRHPVVTAACATTMHQFTRGRFSLGLGRGIAPLIGALGIPPVTMAQMEDAIGLYRRLWRGEMILGHDGPAGRWPFLRLDPSFDLDIPVLVSALGLKTMEWAGGVADGVILHTFFTDEALARCVAAIRGGAERAGRDPERCGSGRASRRCASPTTSGACATWSGAWRPTSRRIPIRSSPSTAGIPRSWSDSAPTRRRVDAGRDRPARHVDQLEHIAALIPEEWLPARSGTAGECAATVLDQFDAGADGVILHAATPAQLEPVVDAYRPLRDGGRFADREANPGR